MQIYLITAIHFLTPPTYGLEDHAFQTYMDDTADFNQFLKDLFQ